MDILASLKQGVLFPKKFIQGRLSKPTRTIEEIKRGEGAVIEVKGSKVAVFRNSLGELKTFFRNAHARDAL